MQWSRLVRLPRGHTLPDALWRSRHRALLLVLAAHVPLLPLFGLAEGWSAGSAAASAVPAAFFGALALAPGSRTLRSSWAALGLLSCSAALVVLWHGTIEAHFHYFVMTAALALYEEWLVYGLAVSYVVLQHGLMAEIAHGDLVFAHPAMGGMGDGHSMWFWAGIHGAFIAAQGVANVMAWRASEDAREATQEALRTVRHQADHDPLTGLVNRAQYGRRLQAALDAQQPGEVVAVLFVDLDDFKRVNDSLGHGAGDVVLQEVAHRLRATLRPEDVLGRFGGDEFVVCLVTDDRDVAHRVAGRLAAALQAPIAIADQHRGVRASVGIAFSDGPGTAAEALVRDADAAMYVAKRRGKGRRQVYDGRLRADALHHRTPVAAPAAPAAPAAGDGDAAELRRLLDEGGIRAVYQPIVELDGELVLGYEALARGPRGSLLETPDRLFAAARQAGLLPELDWACRGAAIAGARAAGLGRPGKLFVNMEPAALGTPCPDALVTEWERAGQDLGLVAELTERALTDRPAALLQAAQELRDRGWGLALDDLGADVRSLALLPLLDPDVIKLDLRLVQQRPSSEVAELVNAVNAHCERTGALVLAEGIETDEHLATARAMGATLGQGWRFARPAPLPDPVPVPARPLVLRAPRLREGGRTPYELVVGTGVPRTGTKAMLLALTRTLERQAAALGPGAVIASAFQSAERFTPATRRRYAVLAQDATLVAALGVGMDATPAPGVRGGTIAPDDPLRDEWSVAVLGPHFAGALVAVDVGDTGPDLERRFAFALTYDRDLVARAVESLLAVVGDGRSGPERAAPRAGAVA